MTDFKQTELGLLPEDWNTEKLSELVSHIRILEKANF